MARTPSPPVPPTAAFEAFEATTWEDRADGYEGFFAGITSRTVDASLDAAGVTTGTRLLDVATGPGDVVGAAVARGADATGVDIAEAMVRIARRRWPGGTFRRADAHGLPFPDAAFDAVTASFALMHLGRPEHAVAEWVRVLAPGGRLAVAVWGERHHVAVFREILGALDDCGASPPPGIPDGPGFFRYSDDRELRALLESSRLADVTITPVAFHHPAADADELWNGILEGSVRTAAAILGQPAATRDRVRSAFAERVERYRTGDGLTLPVLVKVAAGTAPATHRATRPEEDPRWLS